MDIKIIVGLIGLGGALIGGLITIVATILAQNRIDKRQREQREEEHREKLRDWVEGKFVENGIESLRDFLTLVQAHLVVTNIVHALDPSSMISEERVAELLSERRNDVKPEEIGEIVKRMKVEWHLDGPARDHIFAQLADRDDVEVPHEALNNVIDVLGHEPVRGVVFQLALVFAGRQLSPHEVREHQERVQVLLEMLRHLRGILRTQEYSSKADIDRLHSHRDIKQLVDGFELYGFDEPPDIQPGDEESHVHDEDVDEPVPVTVE